MTNQPRNTMTMRLQMQQKPPVIFAAHNPATVISRIERALAMEQENALAYLWFKYSSRILEENEPCMEVNDGVKVILSSLVAYRKVSDLTVTPLGQDNYAIIRGNACLYLSENREGDVFIHFSTTESRGVEKQKYCLDLTGYSSDASAYFIATIIKAFDKVSLYLWN